MTSSPGVSPNGTEAPGPDPRTGPEESLRDVLRRRGSATTADLTAATGWRRPAELAVLRDLVGDGHVVTEGAPQPAPGNRWNDRGRMSP